MLTGRRSCVVHIYCMHMSVALLFGPLLDFLHSSNLICLLFREQTRSFYSSVFIGGGGRRRVGGVFFVCLFVCLFFNVRARECMCVCFQMYSNARACV